MTFEKLLIGKGESNEKWSDKIQFYNEIILASQIKACVLSPIHDILNYLFENWPKISNVKKDILKIVLISSGVESQVKKAV